MVRPKSDIDLRIVHAARARFLTEGVDGASLRAIAKDANTSIGMVYYYFPNKDDLFLAIVEEVYERLLADLALALAPEVPVGERIERLYARVGRLSDEELLVMRLVVREALVSSSRLDRIIERFQRGHIPLVLRTIADGLADGTLDQRRHPLVLISSVVAVGLVPQVVRRVLAERLPGLGLPQGTDLARQLVEVLLHGIGAVPSGGRAEE
ncbi:MAG TPA: TetR/AcrR family transcriptional regulator [Polyangiaceae bacterium]|nr:TetR/AcrR family transcriptional regulator [Polyangiaceae bacterium]